MDKVFVAVATASTAGTDDQIGGSATIELVVVGTLGYALGDSHSATFNMIIGIWKEMRIGDFKLGLLGLDLDGGSGRSALFNGRSNDETGENG